LTVAHLGEASGCNAVRLTHPYSAAVLGAWVSGNLLGGPFLAHIPHAQLLVSAGGDKERAVGAPGQRLDNVVMPEAELGHAGLDIPDLDRVVAGCASKDVLGGSVEEDVTDFPTGG
jgi:hypothetical protein